MQRHPAQALLLLFLLAIAAINIAAWRYASQMLDYTVVGERTPPPESLRGWNKARVLLTGVRVPRPENWAEPADVGLPFETLDLGDGEDRIECWYVHHPAPRATVLLFHGYSTSKSSLLSEARSLYGLGCSVILADFRGSGGSSGRRTTLGYREADDVAKVYEWIRPRTSDPIILFGSSMGGAAILRAVAIHRIQPDGIILQSVFDRMTSVVANRFRSMGFPVHPFSELVLFWGGVHAGFNGFAHNPAAYARAVTCPTLMLHGSDDPRATLAQARSILAVLGARGRLIPFHGAKHESLLAANGALWREAISAWLPSLAQRPASL